MRPWRSEYGFLYVFVFFNTFWKKRGTAVCRCGDHFGRRHTLSLMMLRFDSRGFALARISPSNVMLHFSILDPSCALFG